MFNFKKGEKEVSISTLVIVAGAVVITDVVKNICRMRVDKAEIIHKDGKEEKKTK